MTDFPQEQRRREREARSEFRRRQREPYERWARADRRPGWEPHAPIGYGYPYFQDGVYPGGLAPYLPMPFDENWRSAEARRPREEERDLFDRATDEVASWFGDEDAKERRKRDHRGRGPKGYVRSDTRIEEDVNDFLSADSDVDATEIEVSVKGGEVTLNGEVETRREKRLAEECIEDVLGLVHVQNNLRVRDIRA